MVEAVNETFAPLAALLPAVAASCAGSEEVRSAVARWAGSVPDLLTPALERGSEILVTRAAEGVVTVGVVGCVDAEISGRFETRLESFRGVFGLGGGSCSSDAVNTLIHREVRGARVREEGRESRESAARCAACFRVCRRAGW
jgi:hypothetical protein